MIKIVETEDGSWTLYDEQLDVHYRSVQGALAESKYVYLEGTKITEQETPWCLLELGLGGGINFLQTAQYFLQHQSEGMLIYHAVEYAPIDPLLLGQSGYAKWLLFPELLALLQDALRAARASKATDGACVIRELKHNACQIQLHVYPSAWEETVLPDFGAKAVYHDPFDPHTNPDAWGEECFKWVFGCMHPEGILATYGAAGHTRRAMQRAGFHVSKAPGHGRKREMTLASPTIEPLTGFKLIKQR